MIDNRPTFFLLGATGVGKSAVAVAWARQTGAAILCLDAMQVYRGADIGTGKPTPAERAEIPHGGLDLAEVGENFDVGRYVEHAVSFVEEQHQAGRPVIAVGGTGLYFRALTRGLCAAPRGSEELRAELAALTAEQLRARLERIDPEMLAHLDAQNPRRLARAIEVMEMTGRSLRAWQEETPAPAVPVFRAWWLQRRPADLAARIEARVDTMLAAGWSEEVRALVARHGRQHVEGFPALGYAQVLALVEERQTPEAVRRDILVATRRYAKRQLTWFAREPNLQKMMLAGPHLPPLPPV